MFDACICVYNEGPAPEFLKKNSYKARKEYRCCECREPIKPGDIYECVRGKWDGDFMTFKTCTPCANIRKSLFTCGGTYEMMWEDLYAQYGHEDWLK